MPSLIQVAGAIDSTLDTLNNFRIDEQFLGLTIQYDLGIDYQPDIPFDESVALIGDSLDGLPERLRSLDQTLQTSSDNLEVISEDVLQLSRDLNTINTRLTEVDPLLDEYIRIVQDANDRARFTRLNLQAQLETIKIIVTIAIVWFGLNQLVPIYVGWEMVAGRFGEQPEENGRNTDSQ
jgi:signal transduction histidine kinase